MEEKLRVGVAQGGAVREFGVILGGGIAVDSRERVFVLDVQALEPAVLEAEDGGYPGSPSTIQP